MNVMEAINARKSIRSYTAEPVSDEQLGLIMEAARLAPSASNRQTWKFIAVKDPALREKMFDACCGQKFMAQAPVHIVVTASEDRAMKCGMSTAAVDGSIAMSFMLLEAAELGLGMCWLGMFDADKVKEVLGIPENVTVVAVSPLGHPAEPGRERSRKELSEVFITDSWK